jgi:hypothetical protein
VLGEFFDGGTLVRSRQCEHVPLHFAKECAPIQQVIRKNGLPFGFSTEGLSRPVPALEMQVWLDHPLVTSRLDARKKIGFDAACEHG